MAAPFVTNVATRIQEANPTLSPAGVKRILMETVDKKPWLAGKVRSGGIVNAGRAFAAAELSNTMSLDLAVKASLADVADEVGEDLGLSVDEERDILVTPMPMFFQE